MSELRAWSYSALNDFLNCPRAYQIKRVTKEIPFTETEQMKYGTITHKFLEDRITKKEPLPEHLAWMENMMVAIETSGGEVLAEQKMAIDGGLRPVEWFDKDVWVRAIMDGGVRYKDKSILYDYKTGKRRYDKDQLMLAAAIEFAHFINVDVVKTGYVWLKDKVIDTETYTRDDVPTIWKHFIPKVERLNTAFETDKWEPKPSGLCGWCPATLAHCKFAKEKK